MREAAFERGGGGGGGWSTPWTAGFGVCRALWRPDATRKRGGRSELGASGVRATDETSMNPSHARRRILPEVEYSEAQVGGFK